MPLLLTQEKIQSAILEEKKPPFTFSDMVQKTTFHTDTARLLIGNIRRICLTLITFPDTFGHNLIWAKYLTTQLGPILTLAGFLIYLPRTIVNGINIYQIISEKPHIPLQSRLKACYDTDDRLFNLINDFPSVLSGFISVFILTTTTAWLAAYITVAVKFWEVNAATAKNIYDVSCLQALRTEYEGHIKDISHHSNNSNNSSQAIIAYLEHLDEHIAHTREIRNINAVMHTLLLPCLLAFTPPIMMLHPAVPLLAAIFAISLVCLRFSDFRDLWLTAPPPQAALHAVQPPILFFKPETEPPADVPIDYLNNSQALGAPSLNYT
ncbi:MAG: hypothetical protein K0U24_03520 [Gammaproteobacteria bacterium]|nr:hypothetical protein [Gammaproteobacteria bacterium]MCH9716101.1 hypothetical protein [Gammaproteobacteria bacterium]MCH9763285.1 hypothetical protein [Gammaproteobacteria bacterium]